MASEFHNWKIALDSCLETQFGLAPELRRLVIWILDFFRDKVDEIPEDLENFTLLECKNFMRSAFDLKNLFLMLIGGSVVLLMLTSLFLQILILWKQSKYAKILRSQKILEDKSTSAEPREDPKPEVQSQDQMTEQLELVEKPADFESSASEEDLKPPTRKLVPIPVRDYTYQDSVINAKFDSEAEFSDTSTESMESVSSTVILNEKTSPKARNNEFHSTPRKSSLSSIRDPFKTSTNFVKFNVENVKRPCTSPQGSKISPRNSKSPSSHTISSAQKIVRRKSAIPLLTSTSMIEQMTKF